ncbi:MAG: glutamate-5-semialdehyde dehydrogenase [Planctomycetota bacterium]
MNEVQAAAARCREAARALASLSSETKDAVLRTLAASIRNAAADVLAANARDLHTSKASGLADAKLKRLELSQASLGQMAAGIEQVADMPDPVGRVTRDEPVPSGLRVQKVRMPLGVIAMIYEARPGVTVDAFSLCFKAGNACLLKGGREAAATNDALLALIRDALRAHGCPESAVELVTTSDRDQIRAMLTLTESIDLVIPRGGEALIRFVHEHARVPTIQHFHGVCHVYVDRAADLDTALEIVATGKTSAPATCNATECALIHADVADRFVPMLAERAARDGFELRGDASAAALADTIVPAKPDDFGHEFLDSVLAVAVVGSVDAACTHIARYGSDHTEAIVSEDAAACDRFVAGVGSSCVLVNASTRFNDGFQLGLGAEIGISTSRIHAYGPMGLEELTIERYVVTGSGQTR